jgi:hypothetical protein
MSNKHASLENEILEVLQHSEAEDGLYFQNFTIVHESEERQPIQSSDTDLIRALENLIIKKQVTMGAMDGKVIFKLAA